MTKATDISTEIWRAWTQGEAIPALPPALAPTDRSEGYAAQACLEDRSASPRVGWKIAATSAGGQAHIGVDGPLAGRLFEDRLHDNGATLSLSGNRMRVAEPEFAFRFARTLAPQAETYRVDDVVAAVDTLHLTLELPDSRFLDFANAGGPALIADNACAHDLVVGPAVTADWRSADLAGHAVLCRVGTRYTREGAGHNVLGDPRSALTWCVNELSSLGIAVRAGDLITTGTSTDPLSIEPGDTVTADFGVFGTISLAVSG